MYVGSFLSFQHLCTWGHQIAILTQQRVISQAFHAWKLEQKIAPSLWRRKKRPCLLAVVISSFPSFRPREKETKQKKGRGQKAYGTIIAISAKMTQFTSRPRHSLLVFSWQFQEKRTANIGSNSRFSPPTSPSVAVGLSPPSATRLFTAALTISHLRSGLFVTLPRTNTKIKTTRMGHFFLECRFFLPVQPKAVRFKQFFSREQRAIRTFCRCTSNLPFSWTAIPQFPTASFSSSPTSKLALKSSHIQCNGSASSKRGTILHLNCTGALKGNWYGCDPVLIRRVSWESEENVSSIYK